MRFIAACLLLLCNTAHALCTATSRGSNCPTPASCIPGVQVWNEVLQGCALAQCPAGAVPTHLNGGGVFCSAPPVCVPGYVWRVDLRRCDYPDPSNPANNIASAQPETVCKMTITWIGVDPHNSKIEELSTEAECQKSADLATHRALGRLIGAP